jgi:hypothetical protein
MIRSRAIKELSTAGRRGQEDERVESARSDTESVERWGSHALSDHSLRKIRPAS